MEKGKVIILFLAGLLLYGCGAYEKQQQAGAAVEVDGVYLYRSTLDSLTLGMSPEDSLRTVQQYVSQWAKDELMYKKALPDLPLKGGRKEIERMVEEYRRALYVQSYERYLVERRMPKSVPDSVISQVYERMPERFMLDESIVKGMLVVVPNEARETAKLRGWMAKGMMDEIEKYAYKSASGYELFTDRWTTTSDLIAQMPMERGGMESALRSKNQIEVSDSVRTYILQVTEKRIAGERMPMDYARGAIEKIVLNAREMEFLNKERERLYNEAIQSGKVKFFE
jgi:hypothetical protein